MGYRLHFYSLSQNDIKEVEEKNNLHDFDDLLCIEVVPSFWDSFMSCKPLFNKPIVYEDDENYMPRIVPKSVLRDMCLIYYKEFQKFIIRNSTELVYDKDVDELINNPSKLFNRCMHFEDNNDKKMAEFNGMFLLQQMFLVYCSCGGEPLNSERFEELLDGPTLTDGNTMHDILMQLVYMYKTFDKTKTLVIAGW